jgi:hypothetical protein
MFSRYDFIELTNIKAISSERRSHSKIWWFPYSRLGGVVSAIVKF